jgi:FkbM family methyltransferase
MEVVIHFLDVGAHKGKTSALFLNNDRLDLRAHIFEPNPALMLDLIQKFKGDLRVRFYRAALTTSNLSRTLYVPDPYSESSSLYLEKKSSQGAKEMTVACIDAVNFLQNLTPGKVVLHSNCEGAEFEFVPAILDAGLHEKIDIWSVSFHHGQRKIPVFKPLYLEIKARMDELGIENLNAHYGKADTRAGKLQEFIDMCLAL